MVMKKKDISHENVSYEEVKQRKEYLDLLKNKHNIIETHISSYEKQIKRKQEEINHFKSMYTDGIDRTLKFEVSRFKFKIPFLKKIRQLITGIKEDSRISGYLFYMNKNRKLIVYNIENHKDIFRIKNDEGNEAYMLDRYFGTFNNKPFFFVQYPNTISLNVVKYQIEQGMEIGLTYDAISFNQLLDHTIKRNLTKGIQQKNNIAAMIGKYWVWILIIGVIALFFLSPQGLTLIKSFSVN